MRRIALVVVVGVVVIAAALRGCDSADRTDVARQVTPGAPVASGSSAAGPLAMRDGVPIGWAHDPGGARAAAVSAVGLTGTVARAGFITRGDMIEVLASARFAPVLARESAAQLDELVGELPAAGIATASVLFRELPLTASVVHADDATAQVEVWSVLVAGAPDRGAPRQLWRTVTVDLAWEHDDWRVDGWTAAAGPTPALATNAPIASLVDLDRVTSWSPAGGS
ncbi:MAG: hypothetical protein AB7R77_16295 [Ilumatobacteraceae bacterium]